MALFPSSGSPELAERINRHAWADTSLGPIGEWPLSLRTALDMILGTRFPMQLLWGPEYIHFYNDAYIPIAGDKHPTALGSPGEAIWPEVWSQVHPMLHGVRTTGEPSWSSDLLLELKRSGRPEEAYFTFSYGPVRGESRAVEGIFVTVTETTRQVISERRLRTVRDLSTSLGRVNDEATTYELAASILGACGADLPFALFYTLDGPGRTLRLARSVGLLPGHPAAPDLIVLPGEQLAEGWANYVGTPWPFAEALSAERPTVVSAELATVEPLPGGPWDEPATTAVTMVLGAEGHRQPLGLMIAGVSPRLPLDGEYLDFLERLAAQVGAAIARARAQAAASEDLRIRDDFLSIAAHELKNPLTPLIGKLQMLQRRLSGEGVSRRNLDDLEAAIGAAGRLVGMIDGLLDISRLRGGQLSIERSALDLRALAADVTAEVEASLQSHSLRLITPAEPVVVDGDLLRLEQALRNLISNAVKYSPQGGAVIVEVARQSDAATLTVSDEGIGIAPELLPRIFERYYRAEEGATTIGGMGLGLFVVHEVVRLHGGLVSVESTPEVGSRFTITLPLRAGGHVRGMQLRDQVG